MNRTIAIVLFAGGSLLAGARLAQAEPMFLAEQYARCTTCHYSPSGGGLLTLYGRALSQQLSTTGKNASPTAAQDAKSVAGEAGFLWGAFGDELGPLQLGIDIRPAHLHFGFAPTSSGMNMLMNADVLGAYQAKNWTMYGEAGRRPDISGGGLYSYEYWASHQSENGWGVRFGRFLPAYGVRFADHTAYNRLYLGLNVYDQVLGAELSHTSDHQLVQVSVAPGRADSIINNDSDGRRAFTATGRVQFDLSSKTALVASGLYRDASRTDVRSGAAGVALGFAPASRLTVWTEADTRFRQETNGQSFILVNETSLQAARGVWLKFSPQMRTGPQNTGLFRIVYEADVLPRTHWNVDFSYYRDRSQLGGLVTHTLLTQLHLYL